MSIQPVNLDPDEVLAHLKHILGQDIVITKEELSNFMHDLRKLIRRDQKKLLENKENGQSTQSCSQNCTCSCHWLPSISKSDSSHTSSGCQLSSDEAESVTSDETNSSGKPKPKITARQPASSFIRPWRIHPTPSTGPGRTGPSKNWKEDPVKLYQHYRDVWKQHRFPGESGHAGLRWNIREKMMGQDPQPRDGTKEEHTCDCECCNNVYNIPVSSQCECPCCKELCPCQRHRMFGNEETCKDQSAKWQVTVTVSKLH